MEFPGAETIRGAFSPETASRRQILEEVLADCESLPVDELSLRQRFMKHLCRSVLLRHAGCQAADYALVLVLSGHATAFAYHPQRYEPVLATPDPDDVVRRRIALATGLRLEPLMHPGTAEGAWRALTTALDQGRPVRGEWVDDVVFCGYAVDDEPGVLVAGGWDRQRWWAWDLFEKWALEYGVMEWVNGAYPAATEAELARDVVALMVRCADADPRAAVPELSHAQYGLQGLRAFVKDMSDVANRPDYWASGWLGGHLVYRQIWGRGAASLYLTSILDVVPDAVRPHLQRAAHAFAAAAEAWKGWGQWLGTETGAHDTEDLRLLWLMAVNRRNGSDQAYLALRHESDAARHLRLALTLWHSIEQPSGTSLYGA